MNYKADNSPPDSLQNSAQGKVLIVDDDRLFNDSLGEIMLGRNLSPTGVFSLAEARAACAERVIFDVVLLDNQLPDGSGLELIPDILSSGDRTKIILMTAFPSFASAVEAIKQGAYDYVSKPIDIDELLLTLERAQQAASLEKIEQAARYQNDREKKNAVLLGFEKSFGQVRRLIERSAASDVSVLITGETGTGKNMVAKAIHHNSARHARPFISINCAAIPETLIETELFGVEKGAFTGAAQTRKGVFELAEGGTLFLDEIGEMPLALQVKLLNVLEDRQIKRVGAEKKRFVDVRIIAATNADPEKSIDDKRFRSDLFYRLSVMRIHLPPLRERPEDVPELAHFFIRQFAPNRPVEIPETEIEFLQNEYAFPGNVRELKNIIERALLLQEEKFIYPSRLINFANSNKSNVSAAAEHEVFNIFDGAETLPETLSAAEKSDEISLAEMERRHILDVYARRRNNLAKTAAALEISLSTLKRKLREFGIR